MDMESAMALKPGSVMKSLHGHRWVVEAVGLCGVFGRCPECLQPELYEFEQMRQYEFTGEIIGERLPQAALSATERGPDTAS